jgi:SAM-dependent methyltransferase
MNELKQVILDIGCGQKKMEGAIGIDFSPFSMADIILDLNKEKLPFEDNSVDYIYTSHNLEHLSLEGFYHIIAEMYRVCKPDAQIYITVPYFTNTLNFANPFHNNQICFNEHTFRFFSSSQECNALEKEEYQTPTCPDWGLRYTANSELAIELETMKIDYLYFDKYEELTHNEKVHSRQTLLNVVENITYWLKVIKPAPLLIVKKSQFETSHHLEIIKQLEFINTQKNYILEQKNFIEINKLNLNNNISEENSISSYTLNGNLYVDEDGIFYPAVDIFWKNQNIIKKNQNTIDSLQKIIDNR